MCHSVVLYITYIRMYVHTVRSYMCMSLVNTYQNYVLVPHVRITKLHCYCKHCTLNRLGLELRLGNIIIAIHGLVIT